ncbi:MAG: LysR substrate-binding domain-containing protein [Pseudomonadota bacterium]
MTLNELRYIVAVARERHFGRAASSCFVSQPTLSVAVKKLEDELNVKIFERGASEVVVTPIGKQIVDQAQTVLETAAQVKEIAAGGDPFSEPLRVGIIHTVGPYLLPHLIPVLRQQLPDMPLIIEEGFTSDLRVRLKQGNLDAIIISKPFEEPGVELRSLYEEPFVVVVPVSHQWAKRKSITRDELSTETVLLLGQGHCFRDQVLQVCPGCLMPGQGDDLQKTLESGSIETIRHMVASGVGVTVLPCSAAGDEDYSRKLLSVKRFTGTAPRREVALAFRKGYPRAQAIHALVSAIQSSTIGCVEMTGAVT